MKKCKCPAGSPFHWHDNKEPTIFYQDKSFRSSNGLASTRRVDEARAQGKEMGTIYGISRNREAELLRMRVFKIFSSP